MCIFTARKRSLRRLCFYRCPSVHGGGMRGCSGGGACVVVLGGGIHGCSRGGMRGCSGGACVVAPGGVRGCSGGVRDTTRYGDTINERAVRILLECILVQIKFCSNSIWNLNGCNSSCLSSFIHTRRFYFYVHCKFKYSRTRVLRPSTYLEMVVQNNRNYIDYLGLIYTEPQRWRFWISPEPISFVALALMLTLTLGINDAIEINVFLSSINTSGNADVRCEHSF